MGPWKKTFFFFFGDKKEIKYEPMIAYLQQKQTPTCITQKFGLGFDREVLVGIRDYIKTIIMTNFVPKCNHLIIQ